MIVPTWENAETFAERLNVRLELDRAAWSVFTYHIFAAHQARKGDEDGPIEFTRNCGRSPASVGRSLDFREDSASSHRAEGIVSV